MGEKLKYDLRGVSADKNEIHDAIKHLDKGLFPNAFCKVLPDIVGHDEEYCNIMHADTAGSKASLAYLYWKETGDENVWQDLVQDAIVMNIDDLFCTGVTNDIVISSTITRNKNLITGAVIKRIIEGTNIFLDGLKKYGFNIILAGGETADVGDLVRTIDIGITAFARLPREDVIEINIQSGDVIVGLASFGQAVYETKYNSGIGSNGLTSARHEVLNATYKEKYPETFDSQIPEDLIYSGNHKLTDTVENAPLTIGKLLLSPTRTYAPILKQVLEAHRQQLHGIIHCTGGGQGKVLHFINELEIVKDNLFDIPPVFNIIANQAEMKWEEMYQVFNMGHRMELYTDEGTAEKIIDLSESLHVQARIIGHVEKGSKRQVRIKSPDGKIVLTG
ncbi:MAG: phosphoribosylformylglycinamidine cyclo-ligase [Bacteroidetes bacterium]|nr:phosphoribosylformylglycinamidine cyclo-ligase [Bacteroidota bacterium]